MRRLNRQIEVRQIAVLVLMALLAACGDAESDTLTTTSTSLADTSPTSVPMTDDSLKPKPEPPTSLPSGIGGGRQDLVTDASAPSTAEEAAEVAVADLATRLDVNASEIEVISASRHTWNDGSLGCPEPGQVYTQALTPGYRVIVSDGNEAYAYHGAEGRPLFYCADPVAGSSLDQ